MKILIAGCGKIGKAILSSLSTEGYDITAIDNDAELVNNISGIYDVMTICGNAADSDVLREAGASSADLFVATTDSDELNMLTCFLAGRLGAKHTISRIRNPEYNDDSLGFLCQQLDLSMALNPELQAAKEIFNVLKFPSAVKVESFCAGNFEMVELKLSPESILDGLTLRGMREKYKGAYLICAVQRGEDAYIPDGNFVLHSGDKIGISASPSELQKLMKELGLLKKQAKTVMILGGGKITYYLAKKLISTGVLVKIIEKDPEVCKELSLQLPGAIILQGDGAKQEVLLEEGLDSMDAFVSLTGKDEENILSSISVFLQNVPKVVTKINREELTELAYKIGLDTVISPMEITSNILMRYARALKNSDGSNVETLYKLMDGKAEALEFAVNAEADFTGVPLKDLRLKKNILIAGIVRGRKPIIPSGFDVIQPGDRVVVLAADRRLEELSDIMQ